MLTFVTAIMDSLTQIVLGAACGEAVLGKKIGNKALLFGGIGGTIPDLDVVVGPLLFNNEIEVLAFHRGFMHSILFAVLGTFLLGWLVHKLYDKGKRQDSTTRGDWILLFFWALFTHPILDCFTPYGTQLFSPFSDYRVAFNTISVVDPIYTLPFLISLIILMFFNRMHRKRRFWLKTGIVLSSLYMSFTVFNRYRIDRVYESSLKDLGIDYQRYQVQPSILNNVLWYGIAETSTDYYMGFYSLLDSESKVTDWQKVAKTHDLLPKTDQEIATLIWFSKGYFNINLTEADNEFLYTDLRYPLLKPDDPSSSVFGFIVYQNDNRWDMKPFTPAFAKEEGAFKKAMLDIYERMKGK
ncbi:MAG: metal-dependent hydrolase [Bacteroidota bacterium]